MRLLLWCTLFTILSVHFTQAGIYRRYVRRNRPRPMAHPHAHNRIGRRDFQVYRPSPWPSFLFRRPRSPWAHQMFQPQLPRMARRFRFGNERVDRVPHFHHQPQAQNHYSANPMTTRQPATTLSSWRPLGYGSPIDRDPTFDYAPPSVERVKFVSEARNRRPTARVHTGMPPYSRPPPPPPAYSGFGKRPSWWKMLAHKQRPKRPYSPVPRPPIRYHGQSPNHPLYHHQVYHDQAEIYPNIQNIVYFQPTDVVSSSRRPGPGQMRMPMPFHPGTPTKLVETGNLKPGSVSDASLYSSEVTSKSEFKPVKPTTKTVNKDRNKEYLFTVVGYKGPNPTTAPVSLASKAQWDSQGSQSVLVAASTTKRTPTVLHAVKTTPVTISTTHNSAVKPFEPTESLDKHREETEESAEESQIIEEVVDQPKYVPKQEDDSELDSLDMVPPAPISPVIPNSFNILDSVDSEKNEDDDISDEQENEIPASVVEISNDVKPRPVFNAKNPFAESKPNYKTSTSVSVSMSKTEDIPTQAPSTTARTTTPRPKPTSTSTKAPSTSTTTESTTTTTGATTPKVTKFPRLPTMPAYKKKPTPIYARKNKSTSSGSLGKYASSSSGSALSKEINGSGEIVVITAGRSKVKEYKPQFIADNTQLLSFDKVAESSSPISVQTSPSPSSTTTKSPLQEFDPMQLLHSWFTKSQD